MLHNGFIYPIFSALVSLLKCFNLVEYFKSSMRFFARIASPNDNISREELITVSNIGIDTYQLFKWGMLLFFWCNESGDESSKWFVYYLIWSNLFTYFYYHVWDSNFKKRTDKHALNRKFLNTILAITFYLACYAYLYECHYFHEITWPKEVGSTYEFLDFTYSIYLSVATAFTLTYGGFAPDTQGVRLVFLSELINTFLFLTIIISNSIPYHSGNK